MKRPPQKKRLYSMENQRGYNFKILHENNLNYTLKYPIVLYLEISCWFVTNITLGSSLTHLIEYLRIDNFGLFSCKLIIWAFLFYFLFYLIFFVCKLITILAHWCICRKDFADYAEFCFKNFGDRVKNWQTFNEPRVVASLGYDNGFFAPGRCSKAFGNCTEGNSATEPYIVAHNLILSHAAAVQRYRQKYQVNRYYIRRRPLPFDLFIEYMWGKKYTNMPNVMGRA